MSADVTLFESVSYFSTQVALTVFEIVPPHYLCHYPASITLLLLFHCQYCQQKLKIHLHQSQYMISDMSTLIAQRFLPPNLFWIRSPVDDSTTPQSASPSDLNVPIALRKD